MSLLGYRTWSFHRIGGKCAAVFAIALLTCSNLFAQSDYTKEFRKVRIPDDQKKRLVERFNKHVALEMRQKYDEQFDFFPLGGNYFRIEDPTRESWTVLRRDLVEREGQLTELKVLGVERKLRNDNILSIKVSTKLTKNGRVYKDDPFPIVLAYLRNGDWYFMLTYFSV